MAKIDRRSALKVMAAGSAGAAAALLGGGRTLAAEPAAGFSGAVRPGQISAAAPKTLFVNPGVTYVSLAGNDFTAVTGGPFVYQGAGGVSLTAAGTALARVPAPQGAVITDLLFSVIHQNVSNTMTIGIDQFRLENGTAAIVFNSNPGSSLVIQNPGVPIVAPLVVDNAQSEYVLEWTVTSAGPNERLYGARVGWTLNPGLTTFPNPRRVFGDGTFTAADTIVTGIDATMKIAPVGPSGVPAGVMAAWCAVMSYQSGTLGLYPNGTPPASTGVGNWGQQGTAGTGVQMTYMTVPLDATGKFLIHNFFTAKQIFVDVWGYLV